MQSEEARAAEEAVGLVKMNNNVSANAVAPVDTKKSSMDDIKLPARKHPKRKKVWDTLGELPDYIDLAGVKYIFWDRSSLPRRIIWAIIVLLCLGFVLYELVIQISTYYSYPIDVSVNISHVSQLPFPRVTICNYNKIRKSSLPDPTGDGDFDVHSLFHNDVNTGNLSEHDWESFFTNRAHQKEQMIIKCSWEGDQCTLNNFVQIYTDLGVCYAFNAGVDDRMITQHSHENYGLILLMHVQTEEYTSFKSKVTGFKVLIDEPGNPAHVGTRGIYLPLGGVVDLAVSRTKIESLPQPWEDCGTVKLNWYHRYSIQACREEEDTKYIIDRCHCRLIYMGNTSTPVCSPEQELNCAEKAQRDAQRKRHAHCPVPCTQVIYETSVSHAAFSNSYLRTMVDYYGQDVDYWTHNAVELKVFYKDLIEEVVEHTPGYSRLDLMADAGGFLGLMLGGSIIVLVEIIDFILIKAFPKLE